MRGGSLHDDEIIVIRTQFIVELLWIHRLDTDEQLIKVLQNIVPYKQLSEVQIPQHSLEGGLALLEDLFTVGYK